MKKTSLIGVFFVLLIITGFVASSVYAGTINYFTSIGTKAAQAQVEAFDKKNTGIKIDWIRLSAVKLSNRIITERLAGKKNIDVVNSSDAFDLEYMIEKGWVSNYVSKIDEAKNYPSSLKHDQGYWIPLRLNDLAIVVNTDKINPADAPKSWKDLLDPKYKDKIGIGDPSRSATSFIMFYFMHKKFGIEYIRSLLDNGALIMGALSAVRGGLFTGERPIGVTSTYGVTAAIRKKKMPLKIFIPEEGMPILPSPLFIPEGAPNLTDAKRFADFMLSKDGQDLIVNEVFAYSAHKDMGPPPGMPPLSEINTWLYDWKEVYKTKDDYTSQWEPLLQGKVKKSKKK